MDVPIASRHLAYAPTVARNWVRRLKAALDARFSAGHTVTWTAQEPAAGVPYVQFLDVAQAGRAVGRLRVTWDPARGEALRIEPTAEGLPVEKTALGSLLGLLAVGGALAAFGLWVWFAIHDWSRVWNRVASTFGPDREDRATKLEVGWLLVGWAVGPAFVGFGVGALGDKVDRAAAGRRARRVEAFGRTELEPLIVASVEEGRAAARADEQTAADLGVS